MRTLTLAMRSSFTILPGFRRIMESLQSIDPALMQESLALFPKPNVILNDRLFAIRLTIMNVMLVRFLMRPSQKRRSLEACPCRGGLGQSLAYDAKEKPLKQ